MFQRRNPKQRAEVTFPSCIPQRWKGPHTSVGLPDSREALEGLRPVAICIRWTQVTWWSWDKKASEHRPLESRTGRTCYGIFQGVKYVAEKPHFPGLGCAAHLVLGIQLLPPLPHSLLDHSSGSLRQPALRRHCNEHASLPANLSARLQKLSCEMLEFLGGVWELQRYCGPEVIAGVKAGGGCPLFLTPSFPDRPPVWLVGCPLQLASFAPSQSPRLASDGFLLLQSMITYGCPPSSLHSLTRARSCCSSLFPSWQHHLTGLSLGSVIYRAWPQEPPNPASTLQYCGFAAWPPQLPPRLWAMVSNNRALPWAGTWGPEDEPK
jgi:hypothetical protein